MNFENALQNIHWIAILFAALSTFIIGGIWYTVFKKQWLECNQFSEADLNKRNMPKIFLLTFLFSILMSFNLALFVGKSDVIFGAIAGFLTGFGWVAFAIAIIALFENRPLKYIIINGGYMIISFTVMGMILGGWK